MARLYARLAGLALFRWGGEYTWVTTGPYSTGSTEPLPLPTTLIGAVLGSKKGAELDEEEVLKTLSERLGCSIEALRGPYYPLDNGGIALHVYPGSLLLLDAEGRAAGLARIEGVVHRGTALQRHRKSVAPGMLYAVSMLDPARLLFGSGTRIEPEPSLDALGCNAGERRLGAARLGGDARIATLGLDADERLARLLADTNGYCIAASPILLDDTKKAEKLLRGEELELGDCRLRAASITEAVDVAGDASKAKTLRVKIEVLHPGVYSDTGFPRRPAAAVLPGSLLRCTCSREALRNGIGLYSRLGFGTLAPVKPYKETV